MSEKRFAWKTEKLQHSDDEVLLVVDNENKEWKGHILNIVDLLNEQQSTIQELERKVKKYAKIGEEQLKQIIELQEENGQLKAKASSWKITCSQEINEKNVLFMKNRQLQEENEQLRKQCFELEKDYVIETSDISDKIYLDDEIRELKKKYGVTNE